MKKKIIKKKIKKEEEQPHYCHELYDFFGMKRIWKIYKELHCLPNYQYFDISATVSTIDRNKLWVRLYRKHERVNIRDTVMFDFTVDYTKFDEMVEIVNKEINSTFSGDFTHTDIDSGLRSQTYEQMHTMYDYISKPQSVMGSEMDSHKYMNEASFDTLYSSTDMLVAIQ